MMVLGLGMRQLVSVQHTFAPGIKNAYPLAWAAYTIITVKDCES